MASDEFHDASATSQTDRLPGRAASHSPNSDSPDFGGERPASDGSTAAGATGSADETHLPFYDRLAALIEPQASANHQMPQPEDATPDHPEHMRSASSPPFDDENDASRRRVAAFVAGAAAAVAAGGIMLSLLPGTGEPPAIVAAATNEPAVSRLPLEEEPQTVAPAVTVAREDHMAQSRITTGSITAAPLNQRATTMPSIRGPLEGANAERNEPRLPVGAPFNPKGSGPELESQQKADDPLKEKAVPEARGFDTVVVPASSAIRVAQAATHVNMRAGPDNAEPVLAIIPAGSPMEILKCETWCEVLFDGHRGWVYKSFIGTAGGAGASDP